MRPEKKIESRRTFQPSYASSEAKSSLFLKTMISDFFLASGAFLNQNPINIAAVFVDPVQKEG